MYLVDTNVWLERLLDQKSSDEVGRLAWQPPGDDGDCEESARGGRRGNLPAPELVRYHGDCRVTSFLAMSTER